MKESLKKIKQTKWQIIQEVKVNRKVGSGNEDSFGEGTDVASRHCRRTGKDKEDRMQG